MVQPLDAQSLDALFRQARTQNDWAAEPITDVQIREIYDTAKFGPTSANSSPARFVWIVGAAAKARLSPHLIEGNRDKANKASAVVIVGYDLDFPEQMPKLFPHAPEARNWFGEGAARELVALRNASLQGAYLLLAARAHGWDTGAMSGFNNASLDADFFAGTQIKSNFLVLVGRGSGERMFDRLPRLDFADANTVL